MYEVRLIKQPTSRPAWLLCWFISDFISDPFSRESINLAANFAPYNALSLQPPQLQPRPSPVTVSSHLQVASFPMLHDVAMACVIPAEMMACTKAVSRKPASGNKLMNKARVLWDYTENFDRYHRKKGQSRMWTKVKIEVTINSFCPDD